MLVVQCWKRRQNGTGNVKKKKKRPNVGNVKQNGVGHVQNTERPNAGNVNKKVANNVEHVNVENEKTSPVF